MIGDYKIVRFDLYCTKCKHENDPQEEDPCHECLNNPGNIDSHKPVKFEEKNK